MDLSQVRQAVDAGNAAWIEAFRQQNAAALAEVFAEDGAMLRANGQVARGREAIQELMQAGMAKLGPTEMTIDTDGLWIVDNLAYETGRYTYAYTIDGEERRSAGRYVVVWSPDDEGVWKIKADMGLPDD